MTQLLGPTKVINCGGEIELSIHSCSKLFGLEIKHVFQSVNADKLLIIPTMQKANVDLASIGVDVEMEKDRLLENVMNNMVLMKSLFHAILILSLIRLLSTYVNK